MKGRFITPENQERADKLFELLQKQKCEHKESKEERIVWAVIKYTLLYPAGILFIATLWISAYNRLIREDKVFVPIVDNRSSEALKTPVSNKTPQHR